MPNRAPAAAPRASAPPAAQAAPDPMMDPNLKKQVELGRAVAYHLLKGLKVISMYRHNEAKYGEYLQKAWESLGEYTKVYGTLNLKVELTNFTIHKQDLFTEENPIPYKFFKDGIRQLIFRDGFSLQEMTTFTMIALSDPDRGADDINAQLWRAQMPNFEYIMVEGFKIDEMNEEEVQVEVDKIVDYLQRRLRTNSEDYVRFARLSEQDLEMQMNDVDQMRGVVITGVTATPDLKAKLQREIHEEENQRLFPKLISAVFQVVENGVTDAALLGDMFTQLLDAMLLQEDFAIINQVVLKLRAMEQRAGADSSIGDLSRNFLAKMGEEQRLNRIGEILKYSKLKNPPEVIKYLSNISVERVDALLGTLEVIELAENRMLLCDVLVAFAKTNPDPFVEKLKHSEKPQMQRDMIYVLDRSNHPEKLKFFGTVMKSKNLALRLEVMAIIARGRTGEARKLISAMLEDETMQIRLQAARVLPEFDREKAYIDLLRMVKDKKFEDRQPQEKEGLYSALGSTGMPGAIQYFTQVLAQKSSLFNKQKLIAEKTLALAGLAGACTIQTAKLLGDFAEDKSQPTEVTQAARMHLAKVRKALGLNQVEKEA
ncbi:MAG TPA: HEAT repeat domain-containing protein [Archangium sp.]